jgi:putative dehydrogenase
MTVNHTSDRHTPIGFIGIGNMGFAMMARLLSQDWPVAVYDIDPEALQKAKLLGATVLSTPADIAKQCQRTFVVVVDAAQVNQVLNGTDGFLSSAQTDQIIFLCPTLGPLDVANFATQVQTRGLHLIDAPMSGGPIRAREGQMSFMLAGAQTVLAAQAALLNAITTHRFVISEVAGDAAKTKLANNLLAGINLAGVSEVLAMAQSWGLNAQTTLAVMQASSGQSWIGQDRMQRALQNDFEPRAHTTLLAKDTRLALEACQDMSVKKPALGVVATEQFASACLNGFAHLDDASLFLQAGGLPIDQSSN